MASTMQKVVTWSLRKKMTNRDLQSLMNDIYNKFFCKWRDNLPEIHDTAGWTKIYDEALALVDKYECFDDDKFAPCSTIIETLTHILDDRKRGL